MIAVYTSRRNDLSVCNQEPDIALRHIRTDIYDIM